MGWATKKSSTWELRHLTWTFLSILMFIPFPIHIHPLVMMNRASKSKVRSWYITSWILLAVELCLLGSFSFLMAQAGAIGGMLTGTIFISTVVGSAISYIIGNSLLINQSKSYLQRLELGEVRPLNWIPSIETQRRLELAAPTLDTPQLFIERLMYWRKEIDNKRIHQDIDKIIRLFHLLEKKDRLEAEKFLVRHSTVVNVLIQYDELENANLNNSVTRESKDKLEMVLNQASQAIEQEVTNLFKTGMLDVSAETDVYLQTLKSRNLLKD